MKTKEQWNDIYRTICFNDPAVSGQLLPNPQNIDFIDQVQSDARFDLEEKILEKDQTIAYLANELKHISKSLCGVEIGKAMEGIDEDETDISMVYSFVEGAIDKQAYRADKAEQELNQLKSQNAELLRDMEKLEETLANVLGVEKGEPNAGDDPTKEYWIGIDQVCYESRRAAIDASIEK